jgi:dipeptidyl aminopeptidase/acylaminoacyl peptidase
MRELLSRPALLIALIAICALGAALLFIAAQTVWTEVRSLTPTRAPVDANEPALALFDVREVTFTSSDGVRLRGWHIPSRNGAALGLVHGYGANRKQLAPEAAILARHGYGVLLFDSRAHGESGGDRTTFGDLEQRDVRAAVDFLVQQAAADGSAREGGVARVGLLGFSAGASAVVLEAASDVRVAAVALAAATTSLRDFARDEAGLLAFVRAPIAVATLRALGIDVDAVEPIAAVAKLAPRALLLIQGEKDSVVPVARARALFAAAAQPKALVVLAAAGHGGYASGDPLAYAETLLSFFDRHLHTQALNRATPAATE